MSQNDEIRRELKTIESDLAEVKEEFTAPASPRSRVATAVRALRHRNFQLFFAGQLISLVGTWMQTVAQSWLVYRMTGSTLLLGTVGFASQIPVFLVAPIGGIVADRCDQEHRNLAGKTHRPQQQRRSRHAIHQPRLCDSLHPGPDQRDKLPGEEQLEVTMPQRAHRRRHSRPRRRGNSELLLFLLQLGVNPFQFRAWQVSLSHIRIGCANSVNCFWTGSPSLHWRGLKHTLRPHRSTQCVRLPDARATAIVLTTPFPT